MQHPPPTSQDSVSLTSPTPATYSDHRRRMATYISTKTSAYAPSRVASKDDKLYAGFTDLPPELRNRIYELIAPPRNQHVTICAEKDARDVPYAFSRTCRLVRRETAPYFLSGEGATLILVLRDVEDAAACRDWVSFVPAYPLGEVRTIRIKHLHCCCDPEAVTYGYSSGRCCRRGCEVVFVFDLNDENPVRCIGQLLGGCKATKTFSRQSAVLQAVVKEMPVEVEGSRAGGRKMTRECLDAVVWMLSGFARGGVHGREGG